MTGMRIEQRLAELGVKLPEPMAAPAGLVLPFPWVRVWENRAYVSGHGPLRPDGTLWPALGQVGTDLTGFNRTPAVINGFSDLILDLWGPQAAPHARSAIGVAALPLDLPVEIEAEVAITP